MELYTLNLNIDLNKLVFIIYFIPRQRRRSLSISCFTNIVKLHAMFKKNEMVKVKKKKKI